MFKVGDKVRRTGDDFGFVVKSNIYKIEDIVFRHGHDCLILEGQTGNCPNYDPAMFELVKSNELESLIETANKGYEAVYELVKNHSDNPNLYFKYPIKSGKEVKLKIGLLDYQEPAKVFLKKEEVLEYKGLKLTKKQANELRLEIEEFIGEDYGWE